MPRGSITGSGDGGGREVTDKRESYKMGCVMGGDGGERREGRAANVCEGRERCPSMPVGHPEGAETRGTSANAILQLSRLRSGDEKSETEGGGGGDEGERVSV